MVVGTEPLRWLSCWSRVIVVWHAGVVRFILAVIRGLGSSDVAVPQTVQNGSIWLTGRRWGIFCAEVFLPSFRLRHQGTSDVGFEPKDDARRPRVESPRLRRTASSDPS